MRLGKGAGQSENPKKLQHNYIYYVLIKTVEFIFNILLDFMMNVNLEGCFQS